MKNISKIAIMMALCVFAFNEQVILGGNIAKTAAKTTTQTPLVQQTPPILPVPAQNAPVQQQPAQIPNVPTQNAAAQQQAAPVQPAPIPNAPVQNTPVQQQQPAPIQTQIPLVTENKEHLYKTINDKTIEIWEPYKKDLTLNQKLTGNIALAELEIAVKKLSSVTITSALHSLIEATGRKTIKIQLNKLRTASKNAAIRDHLSGDTLFPSQKKPLKITDRTILGKLWNSGSTKLNTIGSNIANIAFITRLTLWRTQEEINIAHATIARLKDKQSRTKEEMQELRNAQTVLDVSIRNAIQLATIGVAGTGFSYQFGGVALGALAANPIGTFSALAVMAGLASLGYQSNNEIEEEELD